jgi:integrase
VERVGRWTEERALKFRYEARRDIRGSGTYYVWEGGTGFGMRVYKSGRRTWVCASTLTDRCTGKQTSRFFTLGRIPEVSLKAARMSADEKLNALRSGVDPRAAQTAVEEAKRHAQQKQEGQSLAATTFKAAIEFYVANRNCAPRSKSDLQYTLNANADDWMDLPLFDIDAVMLLQRYRHSLARVTRHGADLDRRYAKLSPERRILRAPPGYFTGIKAANDTLKSFSRVFRYWTKKHMGRLMKAGILVPQCPTIALTDDILPEEQRVKSVPIADLRRLINSFADYPGNPLHPLLMRLLLATGRRVGVIVGARREYVQADRIVIPGSAARTKVRWNKRHLAHMAQIIPITPTISAILNELEEVGPMFGDAKTWLFPSDVSESGHMEEERNATLKLRAHAGVRFNLHQLRHNVASAAEDLGFARAEIADLLGHGAQTVTDRYIDERIKRQRAQLIAIDDQLTRMMQESGIAEVDS